MISVKQYMHAKTRLQNTHFHISREVSGSVEVACSLGLADAVVDLVETGTTMKAAGLEIIDVIMNTETVLITKPTLPEDKQKMVDRIFKRMQGYLIATKTCMISYNIPKAFLEKAQEITPGKESPTVMALQDPKWVAVQALVQSKGVSSIMVKQRLQNIFCPVHC